MSEMRSRRSPALRVAVRAGAAGAIAAAVAVPLLRRRLRIPAPVTIAACAAGPLGLAVLYPRSRKRDVGLFALQMWAFTMVHELPYDDPERLRAGSGPATRSSPTARSASAGCPTPASSAASPGCPASRSRPLPDLGPLALVPRALRRAALHPAPPPRALPARGPPARRRFRHRLRRLLRGPDGAALVGLRAGPDRRRGAADHGRRRGGDLARGLAEDVRGARRQPLGGDAVASLRDLDDGGDLALRSRPGTGRGRLGLRADPRLRPRLPRRALRHRPRRGRGAGRRRCGAASRSPNRPSSASTPACDAWRGSPTR